MFNSGYKKAALEAAQEAGEQYQDTYDITIRHTTGLHEKKLEAVVILKQVDDYIHSLSNKPGELSKQMSRVTLKRQAFEQEVDQLQIESKKTDKISTSLAGAGAMAGAGIAAFGPTAAMAVATTFGTASTGTAIATLSGAAATNAALAWLGGGALAVGGGGMAAGEAFLALAGPVGWAIGGAAILGGGAFANHKNKKIAEEAEAQTRKIKKETENLKEIDTRVEAERKAIRPLHSGVKKILKQLEALGHRDYKKLSSEEKEMLRTLLNSSEALSERIGVKLQ